eukprot:12921244-Prorocentrum_lima.AAC.1
MGQGYVPSLAAPAGQTAVLRMSTAMGQTTVQPMETPLNIGWEFSQYAMPAATTPQSFTPNPHAAAASTWPGTYVRPFNRDI